MFKLKIVTPKPLKLDVNKRLADRLRRYLPFLMLEFNKTTVGWEHQVTFRYRIRSDSNVSLRIWTDDEIWNWVNGGTEIGRAHV